MLDAATSQQHNLKSQLNAGHQGNFCELDCY